MSVGLVIPTLNAAAELPSLLDAVVSQTHVPDDILIVDSSSIDKTLEIAGSYSGVRAISIRREDFDHGGTRQFALENVCGDVVLFLTQDAVPADMNYIETILSVFDNPMVAMASGRQVPKPEARRFVELVQEFNYPDKSNIRSEADIEKLGIKAFFASDACSAYRRSALADIGGIPAPCATNEDMLAAARLLHAGYQVAYVAAARVIHSHNLTPREQFRRNCIVGKFLAKYASELDVPSEVGEGFGLVKAVIFNLLHERRVGELLAFGIDCVARLAGNRYGRFKGQKSR